MSRRTKKQKIEFSKLILYVVGAITVGVTAPALIMVWKTENLEPLAYLIPAIFAELATATGFYYAKAKAENRIKLINSMVQSLGDKYGINAVVQLAEIILPRD